MDADEIIPLNADTVQMLLESRQAQRRASGEKGRRVIERWPFPGTTQLWVYDSKHGERMVIGTCRDVSAAGVGIRLDEPLLAGTTVSIAVHQPEASYHGKAVVRHCTARKKGFFAGLQFRFD